MSHAMTARCARLCPIALALVAALVGCSERPNRSSPADGPVPATDGSETVADASAPPPGDAGLEETRHPADAGSALPADSLVAVDLHAAAGDPPLDLASAGFLDVTTFGADPSGKTLSTKALQLALDEAKSSRRVAFFPSGTYLVDDTLRCMESNSDGRGCHLLGSSRGTRPVIKLVDRCPGFGDDSITRATIVNGAVTVRPTIKPVLHFWRQQTAEAGGSTDPELQDGSRNYNQVVRNIDFDLGLGNRGATAIRNLAAEGSSIQHVRVEARDGFAGLQGFPSSGGAVIDVEVVGGRHGVYAPTSRGGAQLLVGLRLFAQRDQPLIYTHIYPLVIVGFEIRHGSGPIFTPAKNSHDSSGHLSLIDGSIELTVGSVDAVAVRNTDRSLYLRNVHLKGAATLVRNTTDGSSLPAASASGWSHVAEYVYNAAYADAVVDGADDHRTIANVQAAAGATPADLVSRHVYPAALCSFENATAVNVKDFGAVGDGAADDTAALRAAIAAADTVLLPKGRYRVTKTIALRATTKLCGAARGLSTIVASSAWIEAQPTPLLQSANDAAATTVLANLGLHTDQTAHRIYHLHWRAGRHSLIKDLSIGKSGPWPGSFDVPLSRTRITDNGGGRWYMHIAGGSGDCMHEGCRVMAIEGTREPLAFYMYHHQYLRVGGGPLTELVDAQNVAFYAQKTETVIPGTEEKHADNFGTPWPILMGIRRSTNIAIIGHEGPSQAEPGRGLFELSDSSAITLAHVARRGSSSTAYYDATSWYFLKETHTGAIATVDATGVLGFYRRR